MKIEFFKKMQGQSLIEFALVLPLVLMLIFAVLSFGFLVYDKIIIVLAASQAADRAGEIMGDTALSLEEKEAEIQAVATAFLSYGISKKEDDVDIFIEDKKVTVKVSFIYTFILPLLNDILGDTTQLPVKYEATYRIQ